MYICLGTTSRECSACWEGGGGGRVCVYVLWMADHAHQCNVTKDGPTKINITVNGTSF